MSSQLRAQKMWKKDPKVPACSSRPLEPRPKFERCTKPGNVGPTLPLTPPRAPHQVVDIVQRSIIRGGGREAAEACAEVIAASAERWRQFEGAYRDDISCIVLRLPCFDGAGGRVARPENMLESVDETGKRMGDKEP